MLNTLKNEIKNTFKLLVNLNYNNKLSASKIGKDLIRYDIIRPMTKSEFLQIKKQLEKDFHEVNACIQHVGLNLYKGYFNCYNNKSIVF